MKSINISLLMRDFGWSGGVDFLRNLANALLAIQGEHQLRLFLLMPVRNRIDTLADLRGNLLRSAHLLRREGKFVLPLKKREYEASVLDSFSNIDGTLDLVEYNEATGLVAALRKIGTDVVIPAAASLGSSFPFPWVGYAYDFQHKYFPNFFTCRECLNRDIHFATMLRDAKAVIVNAKSVKADIDRYFPYHESKVFDLPFSASPASSWLEDFDTERLVRYQLPERYCLISNQFWIHKAHITAFRALAKLGNDPDCADLHIVCTGKMEDYRFPDYVRDLQQEIRELGIEQRVLFLGHIPKIDQIAILKKSLALVQPTLFEGGPGGGSVYDAVSLGVPAIVSDIPVNREIEKEQNVFYFQVGSENDLADKIREFLRRTVSRPVKEELVLTGERRKRLMGERLLDAIDCVSRAR